MPLALARRLPPRRGAPPGESQGEERADAGGRKEAARVRRRPRTGSLAAELLKGGGAPLPLLLVQRVVQRLKLALLSLPLLGEADPHLSHFGRIPVVFLRCGGDVR